jgi:predicted secreted protein with PEFG-CTERM motif
MRRFGILVAIFVITMVLSVSSSLPVFAQVGGPANPNANVTTAYTLLHKNGTISLSTIPPLSVKTDLLSYNQGDTVVVTGHVKEVQNATAITLRVFNSLKNLISVAQLIPSSDGSFTKTFLATGPLWKDAGNYTVITQYGLYTQVNSTFHYNGGTGAVTITPAINATYPLQSGGQVYNIPYIIKGATVKSIDILAAKYTLEITLSPATADGSITINLPRDLIDAKIPPPPNPDANLTGVKVNQKELEDDKFIVAVNDKVITQFSETKNQNVRILSIPFHSGDTKIDIVGTIIVPEFGPIAALVLAIAIISIIAVSAKTGLRIMPKY